MVAGVLMSGRQTVLSLAIDFGLGSYDPYYMSIPQFAVEGRVICCLHPRGYMLSIPGWTWPSCLREGGD